MAESQAYSYAELRVFQICNGTFHFVSPGIISHLYISQKATNLPSKILHYHCFQFLLGRLIHRKKMKNKGYARFFFFFGGGGRQMFKWRMEHDPLL